MFLCSHQRTRSLHLHCVPRRCYTTLAERLLMLKALLLRMRMWVACPLRVYPTHLSRVWGQKGAAWCGQRSLFSAAQCNSIRASSLARCPLLGALLMSVGLRLLRLQLSCRIRPSLRAQGALCLPCQRRPLLQVLHPQRQGIAQRLLAKVSQKQQWLVRLPLPLLLHLQLLWQRQRLKQLQLLQLLQLPLKQSPRPQSLLPHSLAPTSVAICRGHG